MPPTEEAQSLNYQTASEVYKINFKGMRNNGAPMGQSCWPTDDMVFGSGGDPGPVCFG